MVNGKIVLEKTTDSTKVEVAATGETLLYLLAALITDVCESTHTPMFEFLSELSKCCKAMQMAKQEENEV